MGQFRVGATLVSRDGSLSHPVQMLADTGAAYSVAPRPLLEWLGCAPIRGQRVVLADGRVEEWPVTEIQVECDGRRTTTTMLMGPPAGPLLLGAITLEGLGLGIDPINRRLIPIELYLT